MPKETGQVDAQGFSCHTNDDQFWMLRSYNDRAPCPCACVGRLGGGGCSGTGFEGGQGGVCLNGIRLCAADESHSCYLLPAASRAAGSDASWATLQGTFTRLTSLTPLHCRWVEFDPDTSTEAWRSRLRPVIWFRFFSASEAKKRKLDGWPETQDSCPVLDRDGDAGVSG